MKKIILLAILSFSLVSLFAQSDSLLKQFKYRIKQYRAVNFNFGGGSNYSQTDFANGTHKNSSSSTGFNGAYYFTKSTDKVQLSASADLSSNFNRSKSSDVTTYNISKTYSASPQLFILNKWFNKKDLLN